MHAVRIEPSSNGSALFIDVVCDCSATVLIDEANGKESFKHCVVIGGEDKILVCTCGKKYRLHPQDDHIHVFSEQ